ncbi:hypothetical protein PR001_g26295 [Phytophthora rubi]|uniref:Uncharacterized protein n=1 Tax=Phytophthora rubi TaxID=129364 RepID=A0A6A3HNX5_9STRA|nr:hypothetical protein PR002_g27046 [Phytophthora rubi]KAE8973485.1 hypothetical protein PR001_g26295 [Phytophthora rubi]
MAAVEAVEMAQRCRLWVVAVLLLSWVSGVVAITWSERGALKLLYWVTDGQRWAAQWGIQNEHSYPLCDKFETSR